MDTKQQATKLARAALQAYFLADGNSFRSLEERVVRRVEEVLKDIVNEAYMEGAAASRLVRVAEKDGEALGLAYQQGREDEATERMETEDDYVPPDFGTYD